MNNGPHMDHDDHLNQLSDRELHQLTTLGDSRAFEVLMQRHSTNLRGSISGTLRSLRCIQPDDHTHDVMQETWIKAFKHLGTFRGEAALSTWMYRIAANAAYDHMRKCSASQLNLTLEGWSEQPHHNRMRTIVDLYNDRISLERSIEMLEPEDQTLVSFMLQGYTGQEIAQRLGKSPNAVRVSIFRVKNRLRKLLEGGESREV